MPSGKTVSRHFTRRAALRRAARLQRKQDRERGRSSGWLRLDYSVGRSSDGLRRHTVIARG